MDERERERVGERKIEGEEWCLISNAVLKLT